MYSIPTPFHRDEDNNSRLMEKIIDLESLFEGSNRVRKDKESCVIDKMKIEGFLDNTYGFRPKRSVKDAVEHLGIFIDLGYKWTVYIDLCICCSTLIFIKRRILNGTYGGVRGR